MQPLPIEMRHKEQVICLPSGANFVRDVCVKNKSETNSVVEVREKMVLLELLSFPSRKILFLIDFF